MMDRLTETERDDLLAPLFNNSWQMVEGRDAIAKIYTFANFVEAFGWMTKVAIHAEKLNHHPEWANTYKTVEVTLSTHDVDSLTKLDVKLATIMDRLAG
jgi:4a-hydroxytetrahydrobiopterin dehydratase